MKPVIFRALDNFIFFFNMTPSAMKNKKIPTSLTKHVKKDVIKKRIKSFLLLYFENFNRL
ncbi:unnamed protein product [marine sediment metagenome]|uniref:Uncharacterized protein n=1 Tax=marine sediment metagenome TaxID=412755 RepID=X0V9P6_9ZZZZ